MDAERLTEIRRKIDQWARGTYDATEEEFDRVIFMDVPDLLAEVARLSERDRESAKYREMLSGEIRAYRAQLAQREAELEALRAKVNERGEMLRGIYECITVFNHQAVYDLKVDILAILNPDSYNSALSDNQESPALTDKEA